MEDSRSRRTFILIIIAALLLHLLGLLFLLAWQHHSQEHERKFQEFMEEVRKQEAQKNPESPEWAEMKARASDFGTTVLFQDEPEFTPAAQAAQAPKSQEAQKEKAKTIEREEILSPEKIALVDKESTQITEENSKEKPLEAETYTTAQIEQKIAGMVGSGKKEAAPKPPITLSTIAKGFLSTLDQGGKDSMSMHGTKGAHPSAEQLNYQRYMEKFGRCVSNSHNIHKDKLPHMQVRVPVSVSITLLRDGTLKDSYISLSSGIKAIDDYVLFIHRDASPGFPPVPSSIKDELLHFVSQGIVIIGQEQSPFSFSMR
jgi:outer membrane biosynthesis protein TonB